MQSNSFSNSNNENNSNCSDSNSNGNSDSNSNTNSNSNINNSNESSECGVCLEEFPKDCFEFFPCCHKLCNFCYNSIKKKECPYCRFSLESDNEESQFEEDNISYTNNLPIIINHRRNRRHRRNRQARNSNNSENSENSENSNLSDISTSPDNSISFGIRTITERFSNTVLTNEQSNNINHLITNYRRNRGTRNSNRNRNSNLIFELD